MPIAESEVDLFQSVTVDDTSSNGGRINKGQEIVDNVANNAWPNVTSSQRSAGVTQYRKQFVSFQDSENLQAQSIKITLRDILSGDGRAYFFAATQTDTQTDISSPTLYGAGTLNANVSAGATTITVLVEDAAKTIFRDTEEILIIDSTNEEYATISGTPSVSGSVVTITISSGLTNAYTSGTGTRICSVYEPSNTSATITNVTDTNNIFDESNATIEHIGSVYENWTITFTSATAYRLDGDTLGSSVATGTTSSTFQPTNSQTSSPYFTFPTNVWEGTPATGHVVTFRTTPAAVPIWIQREYSSGAAAAENLLIDLRVDYSSA